MARHHWDKTGDRQKTCGDCGAVATQRRPVAARGIIACGWVTEYRQPGGEPFIADRVPPCGSVQPTVSAAGSSTRCACTCWTGSASCGRCSTSRASAPPGCLPGRLSGRPGCLPQPLSRWPARPPGAPRGSPQWPPPHGRSAAMTPSRLEEAPRQARAQARPGWPARPSPQPADARIEAGGTAWRMRSLIAMGHDCTRIARAMNLPPRTIQDLVRGDLRTVTPQLRGLACQLWDAWWDKTPPQAHGEPAAHRGQGTRDGAASWLAAAGLDENELDVPGYRPWSRYRPAAGTGIAPDFRPDHRLQPAREIA